MKSLKNTPILVTGGILLVTLILSASGGDLFAQSPEERGLAWETGVWHAYSADDRNEKSPVSHGNYAAQWIHLSGEWKIQSKLFVTLN